MCCLFGMIDYGQNFTGKQKSRLLSVLARACEARGTDATGIAYNTKNGLRVYKRPLAAHRMRFRIPDGVTAVMGHTRMTTQGSAKKNRNNHPFLGTAGRTSFALAHNGVLYNDDILRKYHKLPITDIETDSYVAVQLIEQKRALSFDSLNYMAEEVEGSFCFTVLNEQDNLYFVKGDNPLCIYHYPRLGLYLYASTEEILREALSRMRAALGKPIRVKLKAGDLLQISPDGKQTRESFCMETFAPWPCCYPPLGCSMEHYEDDAYLQMLKSFAGTCGYDESMVDRCLEDGFTTDEIEEFLYCGEL